MNQKISLFDLRKKIAKFVDERDWQQFHSPKSLSIAIAIEAAELMEHFQWDNGTGKETLKRSKKAIEQELADILAYLLSFSNLYDIDLSKALMNKLKINAKKYPIKKSRGSAKKYNEL